MSLLLLVIGQLPTTELLENPSPSAFASCSGFRTRGYWEAVAIASTVSRGVRIFAYRGTADGHAACPLLQNE